MRNPMTKTCVYLNMHSIHTHIIPVLASISDVYIFHRGSHTWYTYTHHAVHTYLTMHILYPCSHT